MTAKLGKFYYENILASQNITARNNVVWAGDTSKLELYRNYRRFIS